MLVTESLRLGLLESIELESSVAVVVVILNQLIAQWVVVFVAGSFD